MSIPLDLRPGDIILTRNVDESLNSTPGYMNHACIVVSQYEVIEAVRDEGVIKTPLSVLLDERCGKAVLMRYPGDKNSEVAVYAQKAVGTPYRFISSAFRFLRREQRGENCVSLVRRSFQKAYDRDFGWKKPDDIYYDKRLYLIGSLK